MKKITVLFAALILVFETNTNAQWVKMSNGMSNVWVSSLVTSGNNIFAGTSPNSGVYLSTNNGLNWTQTSLNNQDVRSLAVNENNIFAGSYSGNGVYKSTDNGTTWSQTSLNNHIIRSLAVSGNNVYAGSNSGNGVYKSTDNGTTWSQTSLNNKIVRTIAVNGNNVYAGCYSQNGLYKSIDNGMNWTQTLQQVSIGSLAINGNNVFAGSGSITGVYKSTDYGSTWTQTSLNYISVYSLAVNGTNIFAGTFNSGVYVSNDFGTNWTQRNEGLTIINTLVYDFCLLNNYIFAGIGTGGEMGVYRRPLSELTGILQITNEVPHQFSLSQNYPNPFNPSTYIKFDVSKGSFVTLKIFDALGREVAILVNEDLKPGTYEADWNASNYSSGVYFYTMRTEGYTQTKRMVLIK
jgi:hypothetical protein